MLIATEFVLIKDSAVCLCNIKVMCHSCKMENGGRYLIEARSKNGGLVQSVEQNICNVQKRDRNLYSPRITSLISLKVEQWSYTPLAGVRVPH